MKATLISAIALLITTLTFAQQEDLEKIDSIVNATIAETDPGLMVGIVKDGEIVYEKYRGMANLQHMVAINANSRSNIASTAKQFTALMILQLSLEEKLNLEDDIRKYLPNLYPAVKEKIKIRQLINHTSGIRDYVELMGLQNRIWWRQMGLDNDDIMALMEKQEDLGFKPGSKYVYSNAGYVVLTKILEAVTEESFNDYSKKFFENLGMNQTAFVERYMGVIPNRAEPYSDWGYGEWFQTPTVTKTNGEGFLFTTLKDQLIYEQAVQNAVSNNNELLTMSQQPIPNSQYTDYGFGLKLEDRMGRTSVHHDGVTYSYHSQMIRFPEEKLSIFVMSNNGNISSERLANQIARVFLPKTSDQPQYNAKYFEAMGTVDRPKIVGQYNYPNQDKMVRIEEEEGKLYWRENSSLNLEMTHEENGRFAFVYDPSLKVVFYEDELVEYYSSGKTMIYPRSTEAQASIDDLEGYLGQYYNSELDLGMDISMNSAKELKLVLSSSDEVEDVLIINRNQLVAYNYVLKIARDQFDRVVDIYMDFARAKNIRFKKKTNLKFQPQISTDFGSVQVTTIGSRNGDTSDILITANYPNGNEIWNNSLGGNGWDKASSILETEDGYLIIGSTSSYGNGNYDIYVIKTDKKGKQLWQKTYGGFYNEYGYTAEATDSGFIIKGTKQFCDGNSDINRKCTTNVWFVTIDKSGKELSNEVLEELYTK